MLPSPRLRNEFGNLQDDRRRLISVTTMSYSALMNDVSGPNAPRSKTRLVVSLLVVTATIAAFVALMVLSRQPDTLVVWKPKPRTPQTFG